MRNVGWNHNLQYLPLLLDAVPRPCGRALDVGCGDGLFARQIAPLAAHVVAIDRDEAILEAARGAGGGVEYVLGDFLAYPFEPASFDFVLSVTALHHMDAEAALVRMAELLRPGGTLAVVGLAANVYPRDLPRVAAAALADRVYRSTREVYRSEAPRSWPPPTTYREIRDLVARTLPGARYRRHLLWRYSVVWSKPSA
jgi:2-polyprenyl-3-methyl-5-hydroxy-6-metoxy-1,4-benzoquinol methylase